MNFMLTSARVSLLRTTILVLLFLWVVRPPLCQFSTTKYIELWMLRGHNFVVDTNNKEKARYIECDKNIVKVCSFL
jgi:hypothetical protein